ncbi:LytTR family DNA-binding domain-containing protein [Rheinheimera sp.]|uniref:LytTR family DNA-binding domain-containing protein n=1 Tax=Rheinheimera sp. TaxID=1869214 RepID=UPI00307E096B
MTMPLRPAREWARHSLLWLSSVSLVLMLSSIAYCYLMASLEGNRASLLTSVIWGLSDWGVWLALSPLLVRELARNQGLQLSNGALVWLAMQSTFWVPLSAVLVRCLAEALLTDNNMNAMLLLAYKRLPLYLGVWLLMLLIVIWQKLLTEGIAGSHAEGITSAEGKAQPATKASAVQTNALLVHSSTGELWVGLNEILYLRACGNYMEVKVQNKVYLLRATMKALELALRHSPLVRCHRSYLVNLHRVQTLEYAQSGNHDLLLNNGERLPLSKSFRDKLRQQWQQFKDAQQQHYV